MNFTGKYISGKGSLEYLDLLDKSFEMLSTSSRLPHLKMLYKSETDMLSEGFIWGNGWWIQNSYGFTLGAVPLLDELWFEILQNSYDAFWDRIGDGKRIGYDSGIPNGDDVFSICAPDGSLGDCVLPKGIVYKQGDGDFNSYDWFYEAAAAGVNMQADILLFDRRPERLRKYIPLMWRSLNFIEKTRDENGLFLVGMCSNLLAPSYGGGYNEETGEIEKAYLTGLAVTYSAALIKFIKLLKMTGDKNGEEICTARLRRTLDALPLLLTDEGYFVKSVEKNGTKHGVYGAVKYGYLEAVCNVDAIAGGVVERDTAQKILQKISSVEGIRPAGIICNNYPHLDDTYQNYRRKSSAPDSLGFKSGDWVDGGCWGTVEGRAILSYLRLGKYDDAYKAAAYYMKWAEEYRQDEPFSQWGHNTNNPWQKENDDYSVCERPAAIMIDNFAAVTCLLRGLFEYRAEENGLSLIPHVPDSIEEYSQKVPVRFGGCDLYISYKRCDKLSAKLGECDLECSEEEIFIPESALVRGTVVYLTIGGAEISEVLMGTTERTAMIPDELRKIYDDCTEAVQSETDSLKKKMLYEIIHSCIAAGERRLLPFDKAELRPMTDEKKRIIISAYDKTVQELYNGLVYRR